MDRILLSDSEFYMNNLTLINILLSNDYPLIFNTINKRLKNIRVRSAASVDRINNNVDPSTIHFIVVYSTIYSSLTEKFNQFNRNGIKVS